MAVNQQGREIAAFIESVTDVEGLYHEGPQSINSHRHKQPQGPGCYMPENGQSRCIHLYVGRLAGKSHQRINHSC